MVTASTGGHITSRQSGSRREGTSSPSKSGSQPPARPMRALFAGACSAARPRADARDDASHIEPSLGRDRDSTQWQAHDATEMEPILLHRLRYSATPRSTPTREREAGALTA